MMAPFRRRGLKQSTCPPSLWLQLRVLRQGNQNVRHRDDRLLFRFLLDIVTLREAYCAFSYVVSYILCCCVWTGQRVCSFTLTWSCVTSGQALTSMPCDSNAESGRGSSTRRYKTSPSNWWSTSSGRALQMSEKQMLPNVLTSE